MRPWVRRAVVSIIALVVLIAVLGAVRWAVLQPHWGLSWVSAIIMYFRQEIWALLLRFGNLLPWTSAIPRHWISAYQPRHCQLSTLVHLRVNRR